MPINISSELQAVIKDGNPKEIAAATLAFACGTPEFALGVSALCGIRFMPVKEPEGTIKYWLVVGPLGVVPTDTPCQDLGAAVCYAVWTNRIGNHGLDTDAALNLRMDDDLILEITRVGEVLRYYVSIKDRTEDRTYGAARGQTLAEAVTRAWLDAVQKGAIAV